MGIILHSRQDARCGHILSTGGRKWGRWLDQLLGKVPELKKMLTEWTGNGERVKSLDSSLYRWYNNLGQVNTLELAAKP